MTREEEIMEGLRKAYQNDQRAPETMYNALCMLHDVLYRRHKALDLLDNLDADPVAMLRMSASKDNPIDTPAAAVKSVVRQLRAVLGTRDPA